MKVHWLMAIVVVATSVACGGAAPDETNSDGAERAVAGAASAAESETVVLTVPSMSCPLCARSIEARLTEAGVHEVRVDLDTKRVMARFDPSLTTAAEVKALVEGQGFPVTGARREGL